MACRHIVGLVAAERCEKPPFIPESRPRKAAKRYGKAFERSVAKRTGGIYGQWFHYRDLNGEGYCQTDVILLLDGVAIVLECKLTDVSAAQEQLRHLYLPVVRMALQRPSRGIVVTRHLTRESELSRVCLRMGQALALASETFFPTLHWIGRGPI